MGTSIDTEGPFIMDATLTDGILTTSYYDDVDDVTYTINWSLLSEDGTTLVVAGEEINPNDANDYGSWQDEWHLNAQPDSWIQTR